MLGTRIEAPIRHQYAKNHAMHPPSGCCNFSCGSIHTKRLFVVLRMSWCATEKLYGTTHATRFVYTSSDHATQRTPVDTKESFFRGAVGRVDAYSLQQYWSSSDLYIGLSVGGSA